MYFYKYAVRSKEECQVGWWGAEEYTNFISAGGKTPRPTSVLDMPLNDVAHSAGAVEYTDCISAEG